jgi:hypothetical protein
VKDGFTPFASQIASLRPPIPTPAQLSANLLNQTPFYYFSKAGRAPYFADWNLTVERAMTSNSLLRVSYHATIGVKLLSRQQAQNQLDPKYWANLRQSAEHADQHADEYSGIGGGAERQRVQATLSRVPDQPAAAAGAAPYPQYSGIGSDAGGQNDGHSTFHALESSFEHRFNHGLFALVSYTSAS